MAKKNLKITKDEFIAKYNEIMKQLADAKKKIKTINSMLKPICKNANGLVEASNSLYVEDNRGYRPAFASLPKMVDDLEFCADIDYYINCLISSFK